MMGDMMKFWSAFVLCASLCLAADLQLGKPLTLKEQVAIDKLVASPADYAGKTVQVKGKVTAVCEHAGCWMKLADPSGKTVRIKVEDGEIVFPKESVGKLATAEGKFVAVDGKTYQIAGTGAVVQE